jgi:hypothetical protein
MPHLKGDETPAEKQSHILAFREKYKDVKRWDRVVVPSQLPRWVKQGIQLHDACGMTWKQVCEAIPRYNSKTKKKEPRNPKTLSRYLSTPAAKTFRIALGEVIDDPGATAKHMVKHDAAHLIWLSYQHLEICKRAGDLGEYGRTLRGLHDIAELTTVKGNAGGPTVVQINIGNGQTFSTEIPTGESTAEVIQAQIVEEG